MLERTPKSPPQIAPLPADTNQPEWSVMIPAYNCIHYLRKTIESVLAQALDAKQMQIEVIDDFSTDSDVEALVNELGKGRIGFFKQPRNVGSLRNFETCINRAKGKFVHILHGDDLVKPGFYQEIGGLFESHPEAGAAFTGCSDIDENDKWLWDSEQILKEPGIIDNWVLKIAEGQLLQTPCIVVRREVYEKLGSFFAVHYGEDWEMWTRIAANYPVAYSPRKLAYYRVHSNNITGNSLTTGQNIKDISAVINIIQNYLPADKRKALKTRARMNYAIYIGILSDRIYHTQNNPKAALMQVTYAFKLHPSKRTLYRFVKILTKILIRYKNKPQQE
ncbi:glycosyltransferase family 2 protein [Pedobacter nyackensis]|uniref:Glycosyl transferase family 2 n=1 Tax=Pedobacter nyackensis TaxID=475255 RepID=A0A1W2BKK1_9SPHI|nr:glycosyltransferase [Pedobacter nyackensis]SMC73499.1 Glycosyl transferase family 2 [Pedobacter nyackensis]